MRVFVSIYVCDTVCAAIQCLCVFHSGSTDVLVFVCAYLLLQGQGLDSACENFGQLSRRWYCIYVFNVCQHMKSVSLWCVFINVDTSVCVRLFVRMYVLSLGLSVGFLSIILSLSLNE